MLVGVTSNIVIGKQVNTNIVFAPAEEIQKLRRRTQVNTKFRLTTNWCFRVVSTIREYLLYKMFAGPWQNVLSIIFAFRKEKKGEGNNSLGLILNVRGSK